MTARQKADIDAAGVAWSVKFTFGLEAPRRLRFFPEFVVESISEA